MNDIILTNSVEIASRPQPVQVKQREGRALCNHSSVTAYHCGFLSKGAPGSGMGWGARQKWSWWQASGNWGNQVHILQSLKKGCSGEWKSAGFPPLGIPYPLPTAQLCSPGLGFLSRSLQGLSGKGVKSLKETLKYVTLENQLSSLFTNYREKHPPMNTCPTCKSTFSSWL